MHSAKHAARTQFPLPPSSRRKLYLAIVAIGHLLMAGRSYGAPQNGVIQGDGGGVIDGSGNTTTITQNDNYLAIDWDSFDVENSHTVEFIQPGSSAVALNRVVSGNSASQINGTITANGHVVIINPNGLIFGESANINVGGLIASGLGTSFSIDDIDEGKIKFESEGGEGRVVNSGTITATAGDVTFLGRSIKNENLIQASVGSVNLLAGEKAVLTFNDSLIGIQLTEAVSQQDLSDAAIVNEGTIAAKGGRILLTASVTGELFSHAVNSGDMGQPSVEVHEDGSFTLGGANVRNSGILHASSPDEPGEIIIRGHNVTLNEGNLEPGPEHIPSGNINIAATNDVVVAAKIGDNNYKPSVEIRAVNRITVSETGAINAGSNPDNDTPAILLSAGDKTVSVPSSQSEAESSDSNPAGLNLEGSISTTGGDIQLLAYYDVEAAESDANDVLRGAIEVTGDITTKGGSLIVGSADKRAGSFSTTGAIRTDSADKGGDITLYTEHDIILNGASFGGTEESDNADVGTLIADSAQGNIELNGHYVYNSGQVGASGAIGLAAQSGGITLSDFTADDGPQGRSQLNIVLQAENDINIGIGSHASGLWLNGGEFDAVSSGGSISVAGNPLNTEGGSIVMQAADISFADSALHTAGGSVNLVAVSSISSLDIVTQGGDVNLTAGNNLDLHSINASGSDGKSGGSITLSSRDIEVDDLLSNAGVGQNLHAGQIEIKAEADVDSPASIVINGDVQARNSEGIDLAAEIEIHSGTCTDCENTITFNHDSFITGSVSISGSASDADAITISNAASYWTINGSNHEIRSNTDAGNAGGSILFSNFEALIGSKESDVFNITTLPTDIAIIRGGNNEGHNADKIIGPGSAASYTWAIEGTNSGFLSIGENVSPNPVLEFSDIADLEGGQADDRFIFGDSGAITGSIDGGGGENTIQGRNDHNSWTLDADAGEFSIESASDGEYLANFTSINVLEGGDGNDTFSINAEFNGRIYGGGGHDVFSLGVNGHVNEIVGSANDGTGGSGELHAQTGNNIWTISDNDAGKLRINDKPEIKFSGIADLIGGDGSDAFTFVAEGRISGSIDGGLGFSSIWGLDVESRWILSAAGIAIARTDGPSGDPQPYLPNAIRIDELIGGSGNDLYEINTHFLGSIDSGSGHDTFRFDVNGYVTEISGNAGDAMGGSAELYARSGDNTWTVNGNGAGNLRINGGQEITFSGISGLIGGDDEDTFSFLGNGSITSIDGGTGYASLQALDINNIWILSNTSGFSLAEQGSATPYLSSFVNVDHLIGGSGNDVYHIDTHFSGSIDSGTGRDELHLGVNAYLEEIDGNTSGIDELHAPDTNNIWRIDNAWSNLSSMDGNVYVGRFKNISVLSGGAQADKFYINTIFQGDIKGGDGDDEFLINASLIGNLYGEGGDDTFTLLSNNVSVDNIHGGDGRNSIVTGLFDTDWYLTSFDTGQLDDGAQLSATFSSIQALRAQGEAVNKLYGPNETSQWFITGTGAGALEDYHDDSQKLYFSGMTSLFGGDNVDIFTFDGGYIRDVIDGGRGNDIFTLTSGSVGSSIIGGEGTDEIALTIKPKAVGDLIVSGVESITLNGGGADYRAAHMFRDMNNGTLQYSYGGQDYRVVYSGADSIADQVKAETLVVHNRATMADEIIVFDINKYQIINHSTNIEFDNKNNLVFAAGSNDIVNLQGDITTNGALTFRNAAIAYGRGRLSADQLYLDGTSSVGSLGSRLQTRINEIFFAGTRGNVYIEEVDDLNLSQAVIGGKVDISLGGSLRSSVPLSGNYDVNIESGADVVLDAQNNLSGQLFLTALGNVTFFNGTSTNLVNLSAKTARIESAGNIYAPSGVEIEELIQLKSDGDIILDNRSNRLGRVRVADAKSVFVASDLGFTIDGIQASGPVDLFSGDNLMLAGKIMSDDQIVIEGRGAIDQQGELEGRSISLQSSGRLVMTSSASSSASEWIDYEAQSIALGYLAAKTVDIRSGSSISDSNGSMNNVAANKLSLMAGSGIGGSDGLDTMVSELFVSNNTGNTHLVNGKEVTITGLHSNADIHFRNTNGHVYLAAAPGQVYLRGHSDSRYTGGLADANYEIGTLRMEIDNGNLLATLDPDLQYPILAARNMSLSSPRGGLGEPLKPLVVYVKDNLVLVSARPSWIRYAFESSPMNVDDSGSISGDLTELIGAGNEQLVEIEELADIDSALFTNVRNYTFDDISIRLPPDQLYYSDDEDQF